MAAVGAGGAALITLEQLLPPRYLRLFTRTVLQTLGVISSKPKGGASFSFDGKTVTAVYDAVVGGLATKDKAVRHINEQLTHEESKSSPCTTLVMHFGAEVFHAVGHELRTTICVPLLDVPF